MSPELLDLERSPFFRTLTRAELDEWLATAEQAYNVSQQALATAPLVCELVEGAAGVAADCLGWWQSLLNESIWRLWHGEPNV